MKIQQTAGHLMDWSQTEDNAVAEIGAMYNLEQKENETIDEFRQRIMYAAIAIEDEEIYNDLDKINQKELDEMEEAELAYHSSLYSDPYYRDEWPAAYQLQPQEQTIRILGIDPGINNLGWAILEYSKSTWEYWLLKSGIINSQNHSSNGAKYVYLQDSIFELMLANAPIKQIALEEVFYYKNVKSANTTAGTIATMQMIAHHADLDIYMVNPQEAKKAATGSGKADKKAMIKSVNETLNAEITKSHEADAAAIAMAAIFHEHKESVNRSKANEKEIKASNA